MSLRIPTFDRWLIRRFLLTFVTFVFAGAVLFLVIDLPVNLSRLQKRGLLQSLPLRYGTMLPELLFIAAPYLTALSALWVCAGLRRSHALLGLFSVGYSSRRIAAPLLLGAALAAPLTWADRELLLPRLGELRRAAASLGPSNGWSAPRPIPDAGGGVLMSSGYQRTARQLRDADYVWIGTRGGEQRQVHAERGVYEEPSDGRAGGWRLSNGWVAVVEGRDAAEQVRVFGAAGYLLQTSVVPADVEAAEGPSYSSASELRARLRRTPAFRHLRVELYQRYTRPLGGVALLLLCLPLVLGVQDASGSTLALRNVICLAATICYFVLETLMGELGARGAVPAGLAVSVVPVAYALTGLVLMARARM